MGNFISQEPNGVLVNNNSDLTSWAGALVSLNAERYKNNHDSRHMSRFEGVVYGVDETSHSYVIDEQTIRDGKSSTSLHTGQRRIYVWFEEAPFPRPPHYVVNFPKSNTGGTQQHGGTIHLVKGLPQFIVPNTVPMPKCGDRVYCNYGNKTGDSPFLSWSDPYYIGPAGANRPSENRALVSISAAAAYSSHAAGQANISSPLDDIYLYNNAPPGYPQNQNSLKGLLEASGLVHMQREIYVDKQIDYPKIKKYNIVPGAPLEYIRYLTEEELAKTKYVQHRKKNKAFFLPENVAVKQRKATKLFIIRESGTSYIRTYKNIYSNPTMHYNIAMNSVFDGSHENLENVSVINKDRHCTIRVNVPYGLVINKKDDFSANSVGCMVSSPFDGREFFGREATWNNAETTSQIDKSEKFKTFKAKLNTWIATKKLPDGSDPIIMGPYGTPGLRTGPWAEQKWPSSILDLSNSHFWTGRLTWTSTGHYFLPTLNQVDALYELLTSILESPPKSSFSWGFEKTTRHTHLLTWNFPSVGGGSPLLSRTHYINTDKYYTESEPAFSWGQVGPLLYEKNNKPRSLWERGLKQKGPGAIKGIVSYSRWGVDSSPFIEHYILGRQLGLGHMESWYVTLAVAAETFPKIQKGKGLGPTIVPSFGDIALNKYLEIGQKMWFAVLRYLAKPEEPFVPVIPEPPEKSEDSPDLAYHIGPPCEYSKGEN